MSIIMQINPFDFFTDTNGDALDSGFIYVGQPNLDPRQYPVTAFYDAALTIPAAMPLRTSNGYIVRNGSPAFLYINGNYSIRVEDKKHRQIYYVPDFLLNGSGSAVNAGDLSNSSDPSKGGALVGWSRSPLSVAITNVSRFLDAQVINLWEFTSYVTNFSTFSTNPSACDWSPALTAAWSTGKRVYAPSTTYWIQTKAVMPLNACSLFGDGDSTVFMVGSVMDHAFERIDDASAAALSPVSLDRFRVDCNRKADWGVWIECSKSGTLTVSVDNFLVGGAKLGSPAGAGARYYENEVTELSLNAGPAFSGNTVGMAAYGLVLDLSATDNVVFHPVAAYITEIGIHNKGGSNKIYTPHAFGNNASDTGPKYCVVIEAPGEIIHPHCDNPTVAGVAIRSRNVQLTGGNYQWAADNTPTVGGATCIEINDALNEIVILGGVPRGANASNPTIRYLGTKPIRFTMFGITPFTPNVGETNFNCVAGQLGVTPRVGARSLMGVDTAAATSGAFQLYKAGALRYEMAVTSNNETGGDVGSGLSMTALMDDGVTIAEFMHYFREFKQLELLGRIRIGATALAFFDKNPIAKPTLTGSRGGNSALTSVCSVLDALGLATNNTTP